MRKPKVPIASVATVDDVEAAFYEALQNGDIDQLMDCWGDEDEIVCVHPGGGRLLGAVAIRGAFEAMFSGGSLRAKVMRVRKLDTLSASVHSVVERIEVLTGEGLRHAYVVATNVYHRTARGWRMVAHHASPGTEAELVGESAVPQVLH